MFIRSVTADIVIILLPFVSIVPASVPYNCALVHSWIVIVSMDLILPKSIIAITSVSWYPCQAPVLKSRDPLSPSIKALSVAVGEYHSLILDEYGQLYSFGDNEFAQLWHNNNKDSTVLVRTICAFDYSWLQADYSWLYRIIPDYILLLIILYISKVPSDKNKIPHRTCAYEPFRRDFKRHKN